VELLFESKLKLMQKFSKPISGYWDGGQKQTFFWEIDTHSVNKDKKGYFVKVGSWEANCWFMVSLAKTEKITLSYAKKRLQKSANSHSEICEFEYMEK